MQMPEKYPFRLTSERKKALTQLAREFALRLIEFEPSLYAELGDLPKITDHGSWRAAVAAYNKAVKRSMAAGQFAGRIEDPALRVVWLRPVLEAVKESLFLEDPRLTYVETLLAKTKVDSEGRTL